ncbi:MAG: hypothetical protein Q8O67_31970 [Deltaproteobacteria bacterium]|nr:hypothetical protein [Deltaproteobacteria bacterium]
MISALIGAAGAARAAGPPPAAGTTTTTRLHITSAPRPAHAGAACLTLG